MIQISEETLNKILYHIDQTMGLYGFGREYWKMVGLCQELPLENIDLSQFYHISRALRIYGDKQNIK